MLPPLCTTSCSRQAKYVSEPTSLAEKERRASYLTLRTVEMSPTHLINSPTKKYTNVRSRVNQGDVRLKLPVKKQGKKKKTKKGPSTAARNGGSRAVSSARRGTYW